MQYHVIHSLDPYLLARLCTELQMEGVVYGRIGIDLDPFDGGQYIHIEKVNFCFHAHGWCPVTPLKNHLTLS